MQWGNRDGDSAPRHVDRVHIKRIRGISSARIAWRRGIERTNAMAEHRRPRYCGLFGLLNDRAEKGRPAISGRGIGTGRSDASLRQPFAKRIDHTDLRNTTRGPGTKCRREALSIERRLRQGVSSPRRDDRPLRVLARHGYNCVMSKQLQEVLGRAGFAGRCAGSGRASDRAVLQEWEDYQIG